MIFESTPHEIFKLANLSGFEELRSETPLTQEVIAKATQLTRFVLANLPLLELQRLYGEFQKTLDSFKLAFERCKRITELLGLAFDNTPQAVEDLVRTGGGGQAHPMTFWNIEKLLSPSPR